MRTEITEPVLFQRLRALRLARIQAAGDHSRLAESRPRINRQTAIIYLFELTLAL